MRPPTTSGGLTPRPIRWQQRSFYGYVYQMASVCRCLSQPLSYIVGTRALLCISFPWCLVQYETGGQTLASLPVLSVLADCGARVGVGYLSAPGGMWVSHGVPSRSHSHGINKRPCSRLGGSQSPGAGRTSYISAESAQYTSVGWSTRRPPVYLRIMDASLEPVQG